MTSVNAQLLSDTIYCDEMEFTYTSRAPNVTATFAVIWGQSKPLDNPDNIHVLIYRCKEMASNCGMCLSLDEKYQCGWCQVCTGNIHLLESRIELKPKYLFHIAIRRKLFPSQIILL